MNEKLYVVTCISNPQQYKSRYRLYREFKKYMEQFPNVELYTVELAFSGRPFEITDGIDYRGIQVRSNQEYWHKENLLNIGISRLPEEAKYIAWIDADVTFSNPNWVQDTIDALKHYKFVQMFSEYIDLGPKNEVLNKMSSFVYAWEHETESVVDTRYASGRKGATGLAWAGTREAIDSVGGLIDWCVVGSGDWHMAYCFIGRGVEIAQTWFTEGYKKLLNKYQTDCDLHIKENIGYVPGLAIHYWHGPKSNRGYGWRWNILKKHRFDPILDLRRDSRGVIIVTEEKHKLLRDLREYFKSRKEDSMELTK